MVARNFSVLFFCASLVFIPIHWTIEVALAQGLSIAVQEFVAFDLVALARKASWRNDRQLLLPFPGSPDSAGYVRVWESATLEDGHEYSNVLETHPRWAPSGGIKGTYRLTIPPNAVFQARVGFLRGASGTDGVTFVVRFEPAWGWEGGIPPDGGFVLVRQRVSYDGRLDEIRADLSEYAGTTGWFYLEVLAGLSSGQDWAVWLNPRITFTGVPGNAFFFDFVNRAKFARWETLSGSVVPFALWNCGLRCADAQPNPFALPLDFAFLEDGREYRNVLITRPAKSAPNEGISGRYELTIPANAVFQARVGFLRGATGTDGVTFVVKLDWSWRRPGDPRGGVLARVPARYDGRLEEIRIDLSEFAGASMVFILEVQAGPTSDQDLAVWVNPCLIVSASTQGAVGSSSSGDAIHSINVSVDSSGRSARIEVQYTYSGGQGLPVFVGARPTQGGNPAPNFRFVPAMIRSSGSGFAWVTVEYGGSRPITTDGIEVFLYRMDGSVFLRKTFSRNIIWQ